jgi:hypothetical protein
MNETINSRIIIFRFSGEATIVLRKPLKLQSTLIKEQPFFLQNTEPFKF